MKDTRLHKDTRGHTEKTGSCLRARESSHRKVWSKEVQFMAMCRKSMRLKEIQTAEKREAVERMCRNYGAGEAPRKEDREEKGRGSE